MEPAVTISNKWSPRLCAKGSENQLLMGKDAWKIWPALGTSLQFLFNLCLGGNEEIWTPGCSPHNSLEVLQRRHWFLHVLEEHEANWSGLLQLFLAGLVLRKGWETSLGIGREALGCCSEVKQQLLCDLASEKDGTKPAHSQDTVLLNNLCQLCALWNLAVPSSHVSLV